ncbi:MAG: serine/threonine-protein kinase, partial [Gaiellaceae bacterium]
MAGELIAERYRLLEPLGRGAMSSVWLAEDTELGRQVAVKMLAPTADRTRFEREARAAAALSDPHVCSLYDYGEAAGKPFMVLEYLPGGSLEDRLSQGRPLPDADTERIAAELAGGLAHAHVRGLVHRDLKPANVLFDAEGRAKIADFGIARMGDAGTLTEAGTVLGTASTISPEQAAGLAAGPASDVYSFGVILFRMLTGRLPFVDANAMEVVRMHRDDPPPAVLDIRPDAPPRLAR